MGCQNLNADIFEEKIKGKKIIIYGAHQVAKDLYAYLKYHGLHQNVIGFAVSAKEGNPTAVDELEVKEISQYSNDSKDAIVLIATPEKFFDAISDNLKYLQFEDVLGIGTEGIAALCNPDFIDFFSEHLPQFKVHQDEWEYNCIDLDIRDKAYKFLTIGAYPPLDKYCDTFLNHTFLASYTKTIVKENEDTHRIATDNATEIYVVGGLNQLKQHSQLQSWERAMVVGASIEQIDENTKIVFDGQGENIAEKNEQYAEMTAAYWIWKNSMAKVKGLCHYRRRFILDNNMLEDMLVGSLDAMVLVPHIHLPSVRESFNKISNLKLDDLSRIEGAIKKLDSKYGEAFSKMLDGCEILPNNMVIAKAEIYDSYCEWIFKTIEQICDLIPEEMRTQKRYEAYLAELLTSLYFMENHGDYKLGYAENVLYRN